MKKPKIHLICTAHLDPVWQWQWEEGCAETLTTFRVAVQLLHEFPEFIFTHNESVLYRWVEMYDPALFRAIKKLIKQKRWVIGGGWFLQPDLNIPDTESILRQIIEGRRYFYNKFRVTPKVAYNFDVFGHTSGLPQILRLTGYEMYLHMRPQPDQLKLPADLYRWRGIEGTEIPAYRPPFGFYHHETGNLAELLAQGIELALALNRDVPIFWGLGDHGGGATRADLKMLEAFIQREKRVDLIYSSPERLYSDLKPTCETAPIFDQELQRCFTGCYTSLSRIKRRQAESLGLLVQTEALCAAHWWHGGPYPGKILRQAWREHLFNDFHDVLPGSGTHLVERDALDGYGAAAQIARRLRFRCAVNMTQNSAHADTALTVLTHQPMPGPVPVEAECMLDYRPRFTGDWYLELIDANGNPVPCQEEPPQAKISYNGWRRKICFFAEPKAIGALDYRIKVKSGIPETKAETPTKMNYQLNPKTGLISQIYANSTPCLTAPLLTPRWIDDPGDSWGDGCYQYTSLAENFHLSGPARVLVDGPIRRIYQTRFTSKTSSLVYEQIIYKSIPLLEIRIRANVHEKNRMLKLAIATDFQHLLSEIPGGAIPRTGDGQEFVHSRWMILSEQPGAGPAIAIINNGQHGYDFSQGTLNLSVLRTPVYCHERNYAVGEFPAQRYSDQGEHDVRILILTGEFDTLIESVAQYANWLLAAPFPVAHLTVEKSTHSKPVRPLALAISATNIRLLALKRSVDKKALILRVQESSGKATRTPISLHKQSIELHFNPWEIKTIRFEKSEAPRCVDLIKED